jgi:hypothetical protein
MDPAFFFQNYASIGNGKLKDFSCDTTLTDKVKIHFSNDKNILDKNKSLLID